MGDVFIEVPWTLGPDADPDLHYLEYMRRAKLSPETQRALLEVIEEIMGGLESEHYRREGLKLTISLPQHNLHLRGRLR